MNSNSNIPATLDLAQSLQTFEQTIAEVLVLGNICSWDGRTLKEREQQIRQAALILAGQCTRKATALFSSVSGSSHYRC